MNYSIADYVMPIEVWNNSSLTAGAKLLYMAILRKTKIDGVCFANNETLAKDIGYKVTRTREFLKELEVAKLLTFEFLSKFDRRIYVKFSGNSGKGVVAGATGGMIADDQGVVALATYNKNTPTVILDSTTSNTSLLSKLITKKDYISINSNTNIQNFSSQNFDQKSWDSFFALIQKLFGSDTDNQTFLLRRIEKIIELLEANEKVPTKKIGSKRVKKTEGITPKPVYEQKLTKAQSLKQWNITNWYGQYSLKTPEQTNAEVFMRIIHNKYPEVMSITNHLTLEQADTLMANYETEELQTALAFLNGYAGRNKYDNVYGAIQSSIATQRSWKK